jgi:3-oxoacyl-[acyl-carrier protein] reductase
VSDDTACKTIADAAARFGRIDGLINNAGITKFARNHADLDALSAEDFQRLYAVNVVGPFQMLRAARALLEASERAAVLMVSSIAGVTGIGSSVAYAASKGALNTMTLSLARVLGPKIRVNALCPGFIDTRWHQDGFTPEGIEMMREAARKHTPLQAASLPEDIADAGLFFISDASRHITGETLLVDAGLHLGYASFGQR